ncbi:EamA family transporter [Gilliamella apicola]|uniref:EamA family transporter n=1 Tax=Gilliamella apicola TaxID=1196095 RepID=A0A2V4EVA1_9GAMM|nr:DMT family transporter [Gilliamella apicola]PXZ08448.1 EamA family transporter [Gilliamella apicola]
MIDVKRNGEWILVLVTILAAVGWVSSKETILEMPPLAFMGLRFLSSAFILFTVCLSTQQRINMTDVPKAIITGCLQSTNVILWILAISIGGQLGEGSFIMSLSVLMAPIVGWIFFKEKPLVIFWLSLPIAVVGLAFLSLSNGWHLSVNQLWFLISALAQAIFFVFNSRLVQKIAILPLICIQMFCTGTASLIISVFTESWPSSISFITLIWLIVSIFIATILRFALQFVGQKYVPVSNAAIIMILEPVFTTLAGVIVYLEPMPWTKWIGCFLILISLLSYRGYNFIHKK